MAIDQTALSFSKGITDVPSDLMCDDNALSESVGMIYENGEHKPIQNPSVVINTISGAASHIKILHIHKNGTEERYICEYLDSLITNIGRFSKSGTTLTLVEPIKVKLGDTQVSSMGNTLIINDNNGVHYYKWKSGQYEALNDIPLPQVEFMLDDCRVDWRDSGIDYDMNTIGTVNRYGKTKDDMQESWNNMVVALYSQNKRLAKEKCRFIGPFFVRAAVKMYDGEYTRMTAPQLMIPTMAENTYGKWRMWPDTDEHGDWLEFFTYSCLLKYKLLNDYSAYSDIVSEITIFVSEQVETMDVIGNQPDLVCDAGLPDSGFFIDDNDYKNWKIESIQLIQDIVGSQENDDSVRGYNLFNNTMTVEDIDPDPLIVNKLYSNIRIPKARSHAAVKNDLKEVSLFYKLADIGLSPTYFPGTQNPSWYLINDVVEEHVLENLTSQDRLEDGFFSQSQLKAEYMYVYNNRLNLANVQRAIFEGYSRFIPYDEYQLSTDVQTGVVHISRVTDNFIAYVTVLTDSGAETIVKHSFTSSEKIGLWFYYPDSRAKHVTIFRVRNNVKVCLLDANLTEHKGLNGAYYFAGLPYNGFTEQTVSGVTEPANVPNNPQYEALENTIVTSEVNNPFLFKPKGYNKVGVGKIMAITTNTNALSQSQHGQHPLLIFSSSGVWGMSLDDTGLYVGSDSFSREVCNNINTITQTDSAVYFSSVKGLMEIRGNAQGNTEVVCVSPQLNKLASLLKTATTFIAYDYQHSQLWIVGDTVTGGGYQECYIYNMKSGTFAEYHRNGPKYVCAVNDYPDTLLVDSADYVYSLMEMPAEADDTEVHYTGSLKTRPIKFDDAMALKSIRQIRNVGHIDGSLTYRLFASNDLKIWKELKSLRGMPWKYFKLQFNFSNMKATDRFAGSVIVTEKRRTNKLR